MGAADGSAASGAAAIALYQKRASVPESRFRGLLPSTHHWNFNDSLELKSAPLIIRVQVPMDQQTKKVLEIIRMRHAFVRDRIRLHEAPSSKEIANFLRG